MKVLFRGGDGHLAAAVAEIVRSFYPAAGLYLDREERVLEAFLEVGGRLESAEELKAWARFSRYRKLAIPPKLHDRRKRTRKKSAFLYRSGNRVEICVVTKGRGEAGDKKVPGDDGQAGRLVKLAVYAALEAETGRKGSPWGILTGVRPTKVIHRWLDQGWGREESLAALEKEFAVHPSKGKLLWEVAERQRAFLLNQEEARRLVSIYLAIPFCPSRCLYCSFPAFSLEGAGNQVDLYVKSLSREIRAVGQALGEQGVKVQSVYWGGGTPTSLPPEVLEELMATAGEHLVSSATREITVEGGRPETLTREVLAVLKRSGVQRLSINPQTMHDRTLQAIGRRHTARDIEEAVKGAREAGFDWINMDLILGLPGEGPREVGQTLERLAAFKPENLTVHTLAVKRASRLQQEGRQHSLPDEGAVAAALELTQEWAEAMGLKPYYLYRQKRILANLENVGYALPGRECLYNIQVMEERQTIIGLGVGAASKWVNPQDWTLENQANPKDLSVYHERIHDIIGRKIDKISIMG